MLFSFFSPQGWAFCFLKNTPLACHTKPIAVLKVHKKSEEIIDNLITIISPIKLMLIPIV